MATWVGEDDHGVTLRHTTSRLEGDFAPGSEPRALIENRRTLVGHPWVWLRQVHGAEVGVVTATNVDQVRGAVADALVTAEPELVLAVATADCVPVTFASRSGVVGVAHAGWRGLEAGVIEATVSAMRDLGAEAIEADVGPYIGPECYEFGPADLARLAADFGPEVTGETRWAAPALDLGWMVSVALYRAGVAGPPRVRRQSTSCTACQADRWFSYRARAESERMATAIWRERSYQRAMIHP